MYGMESRHRDSHTAAGGSLQVVERAPVTPPATDTGHPVGSIGDILVKELRGYLGPQRESHLLLLTLGYIGNESIMRLCLIRRYPGTSVFRTRCFVLCTSDAARQRAVLSGSRPLGPQDATDYATIGSCPFNRRGPGAPALFTMPPQQNLYATDYESCSAQAAIATARAFACSHLSACGWRAQNFRELRSYITSSKRSLADMCLRVEHAVEDTSTSSTSGYSRQGTGNMDIVYSIIDAFAL